MSARRHEQQTRTSDSGHGVLAVWLPFCGAGGFETYGGGILVVVEGDAAIPGVSGPQRDLLAGFLCFCWLKQEEDEEEPTTVQKHRRNRKLCHLNPFEFFDHTGTNSLDT